MKCRTCNHRMQINNNCHNDFNYAMSVYYCGIANKELEVKECICALLDKCPLEEKK